MQVGNRIKAKIIQVDGTKISLSMKRLKEDPWKKAVERYKVGQLVRGKVLKINPFGAFVELDEQIHGLAHISELSHDIIRDPKDVVQVGETYEFKILSIDPASHRLGLTLKGAKPAPEKKAEPEQPEAKAPADETATSAENLVSEEGETKS